MAKKETWKIIFEVIQGKVKSKEILNDNVWKRFFELSDNFYRCHKGYLLAAQAQELSWKYKFHQEMKHLCDQEFNHTRILAEIAKSEGDKIMLNRYLDKMLVCAKNEFFVSWCNYIIRLATREYHINAAKRRLAQIRKLLREKNLNRLAA